MVDRPLAERIDDPGFTPGKRDFSALYELLTGSDASVADRAEGAFVRAGDAGARALVREARRAPPGEREAFRVARTLGASTTEEARAYLLERLANATGKERRWAGTSLAKVWPEGSEGPLLDALASATREEDVRAFAQAAAKVGSARTLDALAARRTTDAETKRVLDKARLVLERTVSRPAARETTSASAARFERATVRCTCRDGLESVLAEELTAGGASVVATAKGSVTVVASGDLTKLASARVATALAFVVDAPRRADVPLPVRVAEVLGAPESRAVAAAFSTGGLPARFRLELPRGHGRAAIFDVARAVAAAPGPWLNDPRASAFTVRVAERGERIELGIEPRDVLSHRFAYREADVPAASHPTIAAALARLSCPAPGDVVWDPFCGSGTELVERALLGPYASMLGTDIDPRALEAARTNMHHAHIDRGISLVCADALEAPEPPGLTTVLTNPPLGRRIRGEHAPLLSQVIQKIGRALAPGGRLVWVSPSRGLDEVAEAAGLALERSLDVDLGGFSGRIEVRRKAGRAG
jgi:23S rRNA G2445 N2-methylase RlmL